MLKNTRLFRFCRWVSRGLLGISLDTASTITTRRADRHGTLSNVKQLKKIVYRSPIPIEHCCSKGKCLAGRCYTSVTITPLEFPFLFVFVRPKRFRSFFKSATAAAFKALRIASATKINGAWCAR